MSYQAKTPLELVHADICGTTQTPSLNENRYFFIFIDYYTWMMWIYILKQNSKAFEKFQEFKEKVENLSDKRIKTLRTDRRGEFIGNAFMNYCKENYIHRQLTV